MQSYPLNVGKPASRNLGKLITVATSVLRNALAIAGFRALIGELSPVISFPTFFSLADSSARTLRLLRMMLLFGPGTGSVRRKERFKWIHPHMMQINHRMPLDARSALIFC